MTEKFDCERSKPSITMKNHWCDTKQKQIPFDVLIRTKSLRTMLARRRLRSLIKITNFCVHHGHQQNDEIRQSDNLNLHKALSLSSTIYWNTKTLRESCRLDRLAAGYKCQKLNCSPSHLLLRQHISDAFQQGGLLSNLVPLESSRQSRSFVYRIR